MLKEPKQQTEKRYRAKRLLRHALFECLVEEGEDIAMTAPRPDGTPYREPDKIQERLNAGDIEIYFVPIGTPHVVHSLGIREYQDATTGDWMRVEDWSEAAKQWVGETTFIEAFVPVEALKKDPYATPVMSDYRDAPLNEDALEDIDKKPARMWYGDGHDSDGDMSEEYNDDDDDDDDEPEDEDGVEG